MQLSLPDPTLTVENLLGVMEKVPDGRAEEVWERLINDYMLKDVSSKCSLSSLSITNAMQCKIIELRSHWLYSAKPPADIA